MKSLALGLCLLCLLLISQRAAGSEIALPAGTAVSVTLIDRIDSATDPFGKQYAASVENVAGRNVVAGSPATIVLLHNNSGWLTQLTGITINGRRFQVLSGAGSLVKPEQEINAASTLGLLQRIGISSGSAPVINQRILMQPATHLRFLLIGSATPARASATAAQRRSAARVRSPRESLPRESNSAPRQDLRVAYLCRASDTSERAVPMSYYIADVFRTSDDQSLVERRWHQYLVATYPYRFAHNPHAMIQCTRLIDPSDQNALTRLEGELKSHNAEIVETRWHYTLGPPPTAGASR